MLSMQEMSLSMLEPMLNLSMAILVKLVDLHEMYYLNSNGYHSTLCYSVHWYGLPPRFCQRRGAHIRRCYSPTRHLWKY